MALESKLVKKVARRARWSKYRERARLSEFDKADKSDNTIFNSIRVLDLLRGLQRRWDKMWGVNVVGQKPSLSADITATTSIRYDFGAGSYGMRLTLPAGVISGVGIRPYDIAYFLSDTLAGYQLEVTAVEDSTHLRLEDVSSFVVSGVAEVSDITCVADVGEFEITSVDCVADVAGSLNDKYFEISSPTVDYYVWYNVSAGGTDPALVGKTGIEIAITTGDADTVVATATKTVLDLVAGTPFATVRTSANLAITNSKMGNVTDAVDSGVTGFTISVTNQGVASNLNSKYFLINSALDAIEYYCWISVNSEGVDPAPIGKTAIPVSVAASASASTVATAVKNALDSLPAFVATVGTTKVTNTNASTGATTDASDVDTTFTISVTTLGVTANPALPSDSGVQIRFLLSGSKGQYK